MLFEASTVTAIGAPNVGVVVRTPLDEIFQMAPAPQAVDQGMMTFPRRSIPIKADGVKPKLKKNVDENQLGFMNWFLYTCVIMVP